MSDRENRGKRIDKLQIMVSDEELAGIDDWRFRNRAASRSAAVRTLILLGIQFAATHPEEAEAYLREGDSVAGDAEDGDAKADDSKGGDRMDGEGTA